ncbi:MAG: cupin [Mycobacterium sp.]|jgi:quercetin dioxygenase-like cupin family protein|nr:cupin [Mycobacterium sp.]
MKTVRWLALSGSTALAVALPIMVAPGTAYATPGYGVSGDVLSRATPDGHDYITRRLTIDPGGSTGWHWHDGRLFGVIREGTLTHNFSDCSIDGIYNAGDPITEPTGPDHVHIGRNLGSTPVVMEVVYIDPAGSPLSEDAPDPGCGFA